jgi:phosphinothricin acetyltransferase
METSEVAIRDVRDKDASEIADLYAHHVLHGTASYEIEPPSVGETLAKIRRIVTAGWPFLVAETGGDVAGYAYVTQFRDRPAYRFACENSIYVRHDLTGRGVGKLLLEALVERASSFGFKQIVAVVGGAEPASIGLHARCGFAEVGRLNQVGWKKDRWLDTVYMQRALD